MASYLTHNKNYWACDIEADNLLEDATQIWCCCVENIETGESHVFTDPKVFQAWVRPEFVFVGHNFLAYDLPMLNRHWNAGISVNRVVDSFVLSQMYNPSFVGGHSLEVWGKRLKFPKGDFHDWSCLSDEMVEYCRRDTTLTRRLYLRLTHRMRAVGFSESGCEIEHKSWNIVQNKQRRHGFPFDKGKAEELYAELLSRQRILEEEIHHLWPPRLDVVGRYRKAFKADGSRSKQYERHVEQYPKVCINPDGSYRVFDYISFNLGSPQQRIEKLLTLGWEPNRRTKKGNPQVDEEELLAFADRAGISELKSLSKWLMVSSRARMVRTWLDAYNEKTRAIHGKLFINSTLRYRHSNPNSANIPAVKTYEKGHLLDGKPKLGEEGTWAYECRDLFWAGQEGYSLVGVDAKGIQLRILANYAYSEDFIKDVLNGDPHTKNIQVLRLANKPAAKKFLYTTLMGGGGAKLAADQLQFGTRLTAKEGNALKEKLIDSVPGFKELIKRLQKELHRTGRVLLCDGTPILVPSDHMVIPYLLQGDESRIMKRASILLDDRIRKLGLDATKVADVHDEFQFVVANPDVSEFIKQSLKIFPEVGESFGYRVKIEGTAKVGLTWASTH